MMQGDFVGHSRNSSFLKIAAQNNEDQEFQDGVVASIYCYSASYGSWLIL